MSDQGKEKLEPDHRRELNLKKYDRINAVLFDYENRFIFNSLLIMSVSKNCYPQRCQITLNGFSFILRVKKIF